MSPENSRKQTASLVFLFSVTYMISYITRINYGAIISEMQTATGYSRSLLSMALTGSFVTYGIGQIISGICGDKVSPQKLISGGLAGAALMNILIPFCRSPYQMLLFWSINGFFQSFLWPPIVKIMTAVLSEADYQKSVSKVSWGSSIGTIVVYLLSPVLITCFGWKAVFFFSGTLGAIMVFLWKHFSAQYLPSNYETKHQPVCPNDEKNMNSRHTSLFSPVMALIMISIVLQGMLRDGATTWMPSYIAETYHFSNEISILTGCILPIFSIVCFQLSTLLYTRKLKNPLTCSFVFFGVGALSALGLGIFTGANAGISVLLFALLIGAMHGVNLMLIGMIPHYFQNTNKVSTVSGVLNSCTYIGSAISTYGIALLSEQYGWEKTLLIWLLIAVCGTICCFLCQKPWERYKNTLL